MGIEARLQALLERDGETFWRDPVTPTKAQRADAVTALVDVGLLPISYQQTYQQGPDQGERGTS